MLLRIPSTDFRSQVSQKESQKRRGDANGICKKDANEVQIKREKKKILSVLRNGRKDLLNFFYYVMGIGPFEDFSELCFYISRNSFGG